MGLCVLCLCVLELVEMLDDVVLGQKATAVRDIIIR